jgi:hypothetical protein
MAIAKASATLLSVLSLAGLSASSALAASGHATTWSGFNMCITGTSTQVPDTGLFGSGAVTAQADPYQGDCSTPLTLPQGDVATRADVYKWTQAGWAYCSTTGWQYGGYTPEHWDGDIFVPASYGARAYGRSGGCGAGYYTAEAAAYAYGFDSPIAAQENWTTDWHGGGVDSGTEWFSW